MTHRFFTLLLAALLCLSACGGEISSGISALSESEAPSEEISSAVPAVSVQQMDAPPAVLNQPDGTLLLYRYLPESELYEAAKFLTMPESPTLWDVFLAVADEVLDADELPKVNSISIQKNYITCDLSADWLDRFYKAELNEFCNSLVMTMQQNGLCENMGFLIDGEVGLLGGGVWETPALKLLNSGDPKEFDAIRASIPYTGIDEPDSILCSDWYGPLERPEALQNDETADEILRVLTLTGDLKEDFDTPAGRNGNDTILYLIWATNCITTNPNDENYDAQTAQTLLPLAAAVSERLGAPEDWFWLREHIEETARILYGDGFVAEHQQPSLPYKWFETEGVYTPPHMGGGWSITPYLYSYTENDGVITAEVAYLCESYGGTYDAAYYRDENAKQLASLEEVMDCLANTAQRRTVTLRRENDGRLTLQSHHFIKSIQYQ